MLKHRHASNIKSDQRCLTWLLHECFVVSSNAISIAALGWKLLDTSNMHRNIMKHLKLTKNRPSVIHKYYTTNPRGLAFSGWRLPATWAACCFTSATKILKTGSFKRLVVLVVSYWSICLSFRVILSGAVECFSKIELRMIVNMGLR